MITLKSSGYPKHAVERNYWTLGYFYGVYICPKSWKEICAISMPITGMNIHLHIECNKIVLCWWLSVESSRHEMYCHDLEVMGSSSHRVESAYHGFKLQPGRTWDALYFCLTCT